MHPDDTSSEHAYPYLQEGLQHFVVYRSKRLSFFFKMCVMITSL